MAQWLRNLRGAVKMGLTWAIAWGAGVGGFIELVGNLWPGAPVVGLVDIWPAVLGIPGFITGALFALVLRLAEGRRRFEELSLPRFTLLGGAGGLLAGGLTVALLVAMNGAPGRWIVAALVAGVPTALGSLSAAGTFALARRAGTPRLGGGGPAGATED